MPLYPLGISRSRDVPNVPKQASGSVDMRWSLGGELACAFIDAPHRAIPPMLHATALEAIHRRICVLPVRFGLALRDEAEIQSMLENRGGELLETLDRLDHTCEIGLRIAAADSPETKIAVPARPQSPLDYIEHRRSHYRRLDGDDERENSVVRQFVEQVRDCFRDWRKLPSSPSPPIRLAFLVELDLTTVFRSRLENACGTFQEWRCTILGPWPPYSFV